MFRRLAAAFAFAVLTASAPVLAGDGSGPINDVTGVGLSGYDPVSYFEGEPAQGIPKYSARYQGLPYLFATEAHRARFVADPDKFAPQFGGFCAIATALEIKATIEPTQYTIIDDRLYVMRNAEAMAIWQKDVPGNLAKARANWSKVQKLPEPLR